MGQTSEGAKKALATSIQRYGHDWLREARSKGGKAKGKKKGFAKNPERAVLMAKRSNEIQAARRQARDEPRS